VPSVPLQFVAGALPVQYRDIRTRSGRGFEVECVANLSKAFRLTGSVSFPKVYESNLNPDVKAYIDKNADLFKQIARDAGQQYLIFLVKHHDGFCLYDSKLTDYKSTGPASAWKQDVLADVARECQAAGLKLIVYYSQPDWHHPDYGTENHARYIAYLHGQVRELLTEFGKVEVADYGLLNGRISLGNVEMAGHNWQFALWGRNLTDEDSANYLIGSTASTYLAPLMYGAEVIFEF
jgi:hypothetical protein